MENNRQNAVDAINHLIVINNDGKEGYSQAAEIIGESTLRSMFVQNAAQRAEFAYQLRQLVIASGEEPESSGGPLAALHRVWIDIKASFEPDDHEGILNECIAGDEAAVNAYRTALHESGLTAQEHTLLETQLRLVEENLLLLKQELKTND